MAPALHLGLGLLHRPAEAVVHLFVDSVLVLVPDEGGHAVDGGVQELAPLPQLRGLEAALLPAQEPEAELLRLQRGDPEIPQGGQPAGKLGRLPPIRHGDQLRLRTPAGQKPVQAGGQLRPPQIGQDYIRGGAQGGVRPGALRKGVGKMGQGRHLPDGVPKGAIPAHQIKVDMTVIHKTLPPVGGGLPPRPPGSMGRWLSN